MAEYDQMQISLRKKGWTEAEINRAIALMQKGEVKRSRFLKMLDKFVYWFALLLVIAGNLVMAVVMLPFLLGSTDTMLYAVIFVFGLFFGVIYRVIIHDIEQVAEKPVIKHGLFLTAIAVIVMYLIARLGYELSIFLMVDTPITIPIIISFVYIAGFVAPYFFYRL